MRFVLIDRITALEADRRAVATKVFRGDEEFFRDHFPGFPIVPGALITETISQTAGWLIAWSSGFTRWPLLNMIESAKFRRYVSPGEKLEIEVELLDSTPEHARARGTVRSANGRIAEARVVFHLQSPAPEAGNDFRNWAESTFARLTEHCAVEIER